MSAAQSARWRFLLDRWRHRRRPISTAVNHLPTFYDELSDLLARLGDVIDTDRFVACGDLNCGGADSTSVRDDLSTQLDAHGPRQFVTTAARRKATVSNLLDVVVANADSSLISQVTVQLSHGVFDHDLVTWSLSSRVRPPRHVLTYRFRNLKSVDWTKFIDEVRRSQLFTSPANSANEFADQLDKTVADILDRYCPLQVRRKFAPNRRDSRWLSAGAVDAKRARRQLERKWKPSHKEDDCVAYRKACRSANKLIIDSRRDFYRERISAARADPRNRWTAI